MFDPQLSIANINKIFALENINKLSLNVTLLSPVPYLHIWKEITEMFVEVILLKRISKV